MKHRKAYPYLHEITDRHGHPRAYLRKAGCPSVALPLPVGSRAFLEAYHAALEAEPEPIRGKAKPRTSPPLSISIAIPANGPISLGQPANLSLCA